MKSSRRGEKQKAVGVNHVALKVGDVDEALKFYGQFFEIKIRERLPGHVEVDMGDQFLALEDDNAEDPEAHFGLVVEDKEKLREALKEAGVETVGSRLDFRDPWGNRVQIVQYDQIQFSKTEKVLKSMGIKADKAAEAQKELEDKGLA